MPGISGCQCWCMEHHQHSCKGLCQWRGLVSPFRRGEIHAFTGLSDAAFSELVARIWAVRPDNTPVRPWSLSFPDRVLLVVMSLRTNLTERQIAWIFSTTDSTVDRVVHDVSPHLAGLLGPAPIDKRYLWIVDGTLIPTEDHKRSAKSKNYRRSVNVQVVCRRKDRQVLAVGKAWPGNRNDVVVYRETLEETVARHRRLIGDGGYRGELGITTPIRGPDGRIVKDAVWKRFRKRRAVVEHVIGGMKTWRVLRCCRRKGDGVNLVVKSVAALWNLRIEMAGR